MVEGIKTLITHSNLLFLILLFSNIKCDSDSSNSEIKDDKRDDYKRWTPPAEYWLNHKPYYNYVYAKSRESKSNNEPYFSEPNNNDG